MNKRPISWTAFLNWGSILGNIITVAYVFFTFIPTLDDNTTAVIGVCFLGIVLLVALIINAIMFYYWQSEKSAIAYEKDQEIKKLSEKTIKLERNSKYGSILKSINAAYSDIHKLVRDYPGIDELNTQESIEREKAKYIKAFTKLCDLITHSYSEITGTRCSVCIKVSQASDVSEEAASKTKEEKKGYSLSASTLVRDTNSAVDRDLLTKENKHVQHRYPDNTDFSTLYVNINGKEGRYWFCNDLCKITDYRNTSFLHYSGFWINGFPGIVSYEEKFKNWPLPYKSTIVAPICPSIYEDRGVDNIIGFLCADANDINIFDEKIDPHLLVGCADGLFNALKQFTTIKKLEKEENKTNS